MTGTHEETQSHQPQLSSTVTEATQSQQESPAPPSEEEAKKWGTHITGAPADPTAHPDNQKAASWNASDHQQIYQQPYIVYSPIDKPTNNPLESVIHMFNSWSRKAETIARNIWHNRKFHILTSQEYRIYSYMIESPSYYFFA